MAKNPKIKTVITDLDNTLFDWVGIWHASFEALLKNLVKISGISEETLKKEIKAIHQKHGTSEYTFLIEEIPSLQKLHPNEDLSVIYDEAIHAYRSARKKILSLYPKVEETLKILKQSNVLIVGYTESMAFYTNLRVRSLNLDGALDFLYSPKDHDFPKDQTREAIRQLPSQDYDLKKTIHRNTPPGELKPNPAVLLDIIKEVEADPKKTLYIGDSKFKDIEMAQEAGVYSAWASYGSADKRPEYDLLREVTHWNDEDVEKERKYEASIKGKELNPTAVLVKDFGEILDYFCFSLGRKEWPTSN